MNKKAPVLFIIFNRPDNTEKVFSAIRAYQPDKLYIAADGPRSSRADEATLCAATRDIVTKIDWECDVKTLFKDKNVGCPIGVSSAISWLFEHEEYGIILEDDCLPDSSFFQYCEELLIRYKDDTSVFQISGTNFQNGQQRGTGSYYFSYYSSIWGWATWRRSWEDFTFDLGDVDQIFESGQMDAVFQTKAEKLFWCKRFKKESGKEVCDTWDYHWFYNKWKRKEIGISPNVNLISNIGFDNSSTHTFLKDSMRAPQINLPIEFPLQHPPKKIDFSADRSMYKNVLSPTAKYFRILKENGIINCVKYLTINYKKNN